MRVPSKHSDLEKELAHEGDQQNSSDLGPYCVCRGADDGTPMICCDTCNEWYHLKCIKMASKVARLLKKYHCDKCQQHYYEKKELMANELLRIREETKRVRVPTELRAELDRQAEEESEYSDSSEEDRASRKAHIPKQVNKKRKDLENKSNTSPILGQSKKPKIELEEPMRGRLREQLSKALQLEVGSYDYKGIAIEIEKELFVLFKSLDHNYKSKYRTILFNIKDPKNLQLRKNILSRDLSPRELVRMSSHELANKELAEYRKIRDEKYLDNIVIKQELETPLLVAKLKGEIVDHWTKGGQNAADEKLIEPPVAQPILSRKLSAATEEPNSPTEVPTAISSPPQLTKELLDTSISIIDDVSLFTPPSLSESLENLASITEPPKKVEQVPIPSFDEFDTENGSIDDVPIDVNLPANGKDEPLTDPSDLKKEKIRKEKEPIWSGQIKTTSHKFRAKAMFVNGDKYLSEKQFTSRMEQVGRMDLNSLMQYLPQLEQSTSRKLTVLYFEPELDEDSFEYVAAFEFFRTSNRAAVLKSNHFKEAFIIPLPADETIPSWAKGYKSDGKDRLVGAFITTKSSTSSSRPNKDLKTSKSKEKEILRSPTSNVAQSTFPVTPLITPNTIASPVGPMGVFSSVIPNGMGINPQMQAMPSIMGGSNQPNILFALQQLQNVLGQPNNQNSILGHPMHSGHANLVMLPSPVASYPQHKGPDPRFQNNSFVPQALSQPQNLKQQYPNNNPFFRTQ